MPLDSLATDPVIQAAIERHRDDLTWLDPPLPPGYTCVVYSVPPGEVKGHARTLAQADVYLFGPNQSYDSGRVTYAVPPHPLG
ncbi:hypothetical protein J0H58_26060 [bacterium]|nr:hypothetical protein [bacterium]